MRNVLVRVYDSSGRPAYYAKVVMNIYQFAAGGQKEAYTNSNGEAEFDLDVDNFAEIAISVNGNEKYRRGRIEGSYRFEL